jgi:hypothetical protein
VDSGRLAAANGTGAVIRGHEHLMATGHDPAFDALNVIPRHKNIAPSNALFAQYL